MTDIEIVERYINDAWYSTGVKAAWNRLKQNLQPSDNSEYVPPAGKSCQNCKWKLCISCSEMCGDPNWCDWEPA